MKNKQAFTLIELIFVMLIISFLSILAVDGYLSARLTAILKSETEKIVEVVRATNYAVRKGNSADGAKCRAVVFKRGATSMQIMEGDFKDDACAGSTYKEVETINFADPVIIKDLGKNVSDVRLIMTPPQGTYTFESSEKIPSTLAVMIAFGNRDGSEWERVIEFDRYTGTARIVPPKEPTS